MDAYFEAVDTYVDLAETKLKELLKALKSIGIGREMLISLPFFQTLKGKPASGTDVFDDYFRLVDYYVETAVKVLTYLRNTFDELSAKFSKNKEINSAKIVENIAKLHALAATSAIDTIQLANDYIGLKFGMKMTVDELGKYLLGPELNLHSNDLVKKWDEVYQRVDYYVSVKQILQVYGQMKIKFDQVSGAGLPLEKRKQYSTLPLTKQQQYKEAYELFEIVEETSTKIKKHLISVDFLPADTQLFKRFIDQRANVQQIILYLKGGVSQAFLILRNTNDVDRLGVEENNKLLKKEGVNLFYIDRESKLPLGTALDNFQGIFNRHEDTEQTRATLRAIQQEEAAVEAAQLITDNDAKVAALRAVHVENAKRRQETEAAATNSAIHKAILSENNYNLLEEGGTVIIIAYGQSGSGKTYTLTRLIQHFSDINYNGFDLDGISAVQFYNDVTTQVDSSGDPAMNTRRRTFNPLPGIVLPADAAERAVMDLTELKGLTNLESIYDKTKMYDVHALSRFGLTLKINPVITRLADLDETASTQLKRIQKYAKACFDAATVVNEIANSEPNKYGQLLGMYRQSVLELRLKKKLSTLNGLHHGLTQSEMHLPVYVFIENGPMYSSSFMQLCKKECIGPIYIRQSMKDLRFSETSKKRNELDYGKTRLVVAKSEYVVCSKYGMQTFDESQFFLSEADLDELCDSFEDNPAYTTMKLKVLLTCTKSETDAKGIELIENYNKFIKMYRAVYVLCDAEEVKFVENADGENVWNVGRHHFKNGILKKKVAHLAWSAQMDFVNSLNVTLPILKSYIAPLPVSSTTEFNEISTELVSKPFYFPRKITLQKMNGEYKLFFAVGLHRFNVGSHHLLLQLLESKYTSSSIEPKSVLLEYRPEDARDNHPNTAINLIIKKHETAKADYVPAKFKIPAKKYVSIDEWKTPNVSGTYENLATVTRGEWTKDELAYRAKFEHCIRISETGADNSSNYSLFDHAELLHANYFPEYAPQIKTAYTLTYDTPVVPFVATPNYKEKEPKEYPLVRVPKTLKDEYDEINAARFTRAMPQNPESSRSQLATTLHLSKKGKKSKLIFIDLAGNEKVDTTKSHIVTPESVYINSTLKFVTEMFLQMKLDTKLDEYKPPDHADPFQKYLYQISTKTSVDLPGQFKGGLKPAIVMLVCAYEYFSSWTPPRPTHEVSTESLKNTFDFISDLFKFEDKPKEGGKRPKYTRYLHKKKTRKRRPMRTRKR